VENANGNRCSAAHASRLIARAKLAPPIARNSLLVSFIRNLQDHPRSSDSVAQAFRPEEFVFSIAGTPTLRHRNSIFSFLIFLLA
jgi:hypothetical protein